MQLIFSICIRIDQIRGHNIVHIFYTSFCTLHALVALEKIIFKGKGRFFTFLLFYIPHTCRIRIDQIRGHYRSDCVKFEW